MLYEPTPIKEVLFNVRNHCNMNKRDIQMIEGWLSDALTKEERRNIALIIEGMRFLDDKISIDSETNIKVAKNVYRKLAK